MSWERIDETTERLQVHNGWLVHRRITQLEVDKYGSGDSRDNQSSAKTTACMVFVIDQAHQWQLDKAIKDAKEVGV